MSKHTTIFKIINNIVDINNNSVYFSRVVMFIHVFHDNISKFTLVSLFILSVIVLGNNSTNY